MTREIAGTDGDICVLGDLLAAPQFDLESAPANSCIITFDPHAFAVHAQQTPAAGNWPPNDATGSCLFRHAFKGIARRRALRIHTPTRAGAGPPIHDHEDHGDPRGTQPHHADVDAQQRR